LFLFLVLQLQRGKVICEHNASFLHFEGKMLVIKSQCEEEKDKKKCSEKYFANSKQKFQNICLKFFVTRLLKKK